MAENLRFCLYSGTPGIVEVDKRLLTGANSDGPRYHGPIAEAFNLLIQTIFGHQKLNYTSILKESMGNYNETTDFFDEDSCLYSMQVNESDFAMTFAYHPLVAKNLKQFQPYLGDNIYMFSRYNVSEDFGAADFMSEFVYIFSSEVWVLCLILTFIFWALFKFHTNFINKSTRRRRIRDDSLYRVLTQLLNVHHINLPNLSVRVASFFMIFLSFYILTYFTLSMKTDIVVVVEPDIINNYDDLLAKPRMKMIFLRMVDNFQQFEMAHPGTRERKLWQKSLREVKGDREEMLFKLASSNAADMLTLAENIAYDTTIETVAIVSEFTKEIVRYGSCLLKVMVLHKRPGEPTKKQGANFYSWLAKDPASQEYILSFAHSAHYKSPYLKKIIKRNSWANDLGIINMFLFALDRPPVQIIKIENHAEGDTYRGCLALNYRDNLPHVSHAAFSLIQFKTLVCIYSVFVIAAVICLRCEFQRKRKLSALIRKRKIAARIIALHKMHRM